MSYNELIKNFQRIRDYMREFYVYGFKSRDEFNKKSARSYDDERRRIESWLGDYMQFRQTQEGKKIFLSIDSRVANHNPLYLAWKTKSFTDGDITLHFLIFDILSDSEISLTIYEIMEEIDKKLLIFEEPRAFDESTVRKKLKEYINEGLIISEKRGKVMFYKRAEDSVVYSRDCLDFFSEIYPCGVVGSYLLDKTEQTEEEKHFAFKHHYITSALDSEILRVLFEAIGEKKNITLESVNRKKDRVIENHVVPLKIYVSVQNGRQYLMAYAPHFHRITSYRIDNIVSVKIKDKCENFDELRNTLDKMQPHIWGVSTQSSSRQRMEYVEFTVQYSREEDYIHRRLEREKRCGKVEKIDDNSSKFSAEVYDASELIPWIRTFICRITEIHFSNKELEMQFYSDMREMYRLYGLEGGE